MCAEGVVLHDCVEGVVLWGGGRGAGGGGRGGRRGAHVVGAQRGQPQRVGRARLRVQRAPQVQHLPPHYGTPRAPYGEQLNA